MEVTEVELQVKATEMVDHQCGEYDQQQRHEDPKQPPEEGRHTASKAHGGQLPPNGRCMRTSLASLAPGFGRLPAGQSQTPSANER